MKRECLTGAQFAALPGCVGFNLRRITRRVTKFYDRELRAFGLKITQLPILAMVAGRGAATMAELSDGLAMDRTTLLRNLRPMARDGLLRIGSGADGRRSEIRATKSGHRRLARVFPAWRRAQRSMLDAIGRGRWASILGDLEAATSKTPGG